jgi:hypothetical protein
LPPAVTQIFVPAVGDALPLSYHPVVLGVARVRHVDKKLGLDVTTPVVLATTPTDTALGADFTRSYPVHVPFDALASTGVPGASYLPLPAPARDEDRYGAWQKAFLEHVVRAFAVPLWVCDETKTVSLPGEAERDFRIRLADETRERRDAAIAKVTEKYRARVERAETKVRKAEIAVEKEREDVSDERTKAVLDVGGSVLGVLFGQKKLTAANVGRAQRAAKGVKKIGAAGDDLRRAEEALLEARAARQTLADEITAAVTELSRSLDAATVPLRPVAVTPKKAHIELVSFGLGWLPTRYRPPGPDGAAGGYEAAWMAGPKNR